MGKIIELEDGSLMTEEKRLYYFNGTYVHGKPIIPEGVEDISDGLFSRYTESLYNIYGNGRYLGSKDNPYKYFIFYSGWLYQDVELHPDTEYICSRAFASHAGRKVLNGKIKGIGEDCFRSGSDSVTIPDGCKKIGAKAFWNFHGKIHLPDSIKEIGKEAFSGCWVKYLMASPAILALIGKNVFIEKASLYFNGNDRNAKEDDKWLPGMEQYKTAFVRSAIDHRNGDMLLFAVIHNMIKKADYDAALEVAEAVNHIELKAALLNSQAKPSGKEREKAEKKELEKAIGIRPLSVADVKKIWEYRVDDDGNATLTRYIGRESVPTIPGKIGKAAVTRIGNRAFYHCDAVEEVYLPEGIVAIGDSAFGNSASLKSVVFPKSLEAVGDDLFVNCSGLGETPDISGKKADCVEIKARIQYEYCCLDDFQALWQYSFSPKDDSCTIEKYVGDKVDLKVPKSILGHPVTKIQRFCFSTGLRHDSNGFGSGGQQKRNKLIKSVALPDSVSLIGEYAFSGCTKLENINVPDGCKVEKYAFLGCKKLAKDKRLVIVNDVLYSCIDKSVFSSPFHSDQESGHYCVSVPSGVRRIAEGAFEHCKDLEAVEIPSTVEEIGDYAFHWCNELKKVILSEGVTKIGEAAFEGSKNVTIHTPAGSYAEQYAKENDIPFAAE